MLQRLVILLFKVTENEFVILWKGINWFVIQHVLQRLGCFTKHCHPSDVIDFVRFHASQPETNPALFETDFIDFICLMDQETGNSDCKPLPSLVICPPTLTGHWVYEVEKFLSKDFLKPLHYTGPPSERQRQCILFCYSLVSIYPC